jgi:HD superfamily phosphohydrolase
MPAKTFRDSVHGDIRVGRLQLAIIDSDPFQRLRYIRQNGLLHMIFPGAVHTRFAHSLGTMHIAQRVFQQLFRSYQSATEEIREGENWNVRYVGTVFELAALLHDIGHCAFSHSIERIDDDPSSTPIFRSIDQFVGRWNNNENNIHRWWHTHRQKAEEFCVENKLNWLNAPKHEEIGLLVAYMAFLNPSVVHASRGGTEARRAFDLVFPERLFEMHGVRFDDLVNDVLSLMRGESKWLPPSDRFNVALAAFATETAIEAPREQLPLLTESMFVGLHSLVSGTVDVDRMDYLLRDSKYAGTVVGTYDLDLLINGLSFRYSEQEQNIVLCISERAQGAVDDFLWSRWQLYLQVFNHKANVMLNALFPVAFRRTSLHSVELEYYEELLLLTDDYVMSGVRELFIKSQYKRTDPELITARFAFLRNSFPRHLTVLDIGDDVSQREEDDLVSATLIRLSSEFGIPAPFIHAERTEAVLIKNNADLPRIVRKVPQPDGKSRLELFESHYFADRWKSQGRPTRVRRVHFFTQYASTNPPSSLV